MDHHSSQLCLQGLGRLFVLPMRPLQREVPPGWSQGPQLPHSRGPQGIRERGPPLLLLPLGLTGNIHHHPHPPPLPSSSSAPAEARALLLSPATLYLGRASPPQAVSVLSRQHVRPCLRDPILSRWLWGHREFAQKAKFRCHTL